MAARNTDSIKQAKQTEEQYRWSLAHQQVERDAHAAREKIVELRTIKKMLSLVRRLFCSYAS